MMEGEKRKVKEMTGFLERMGDIPGTEHEQSPEVRGLRKYVNLG
jgi:hypothetical protein